MAFFQLRNECVTNPYYCGHVSLWDHHHQYYYCNINHYSYDVKDDQAVMPLCQAHGSNCSQDPLHLDVILKHHYTTLNYIPHLASAFAILVSLAYISLFGLSSVIYYSLN